MQHLFSLTLTVVVVVVEMTIFIEMDFILCPINQVSLSSSQLIPLHHHTLSIILFGHVMQPLTEQHTEQLDICSVCFTLLFCVRCLCFSLSVRGVVWCV